MTDRYMYLGIFGIVVIGAAIYFGLSGSQTGGPSHSLFGPDKKRVASIEDYFKDVCASAYSDSSDGKDFLDPNNVQQRCEYGIHAKAVSFAEMSDYDLIQALIKTCATEPGGINRTDRIEMRVKALTPNGDGPQQSDEDFCRAKIRKEFPNLGG